MNKLHGGWAFFLVAIALFAFGCGSNSKPVCGDGKLQGDEVCDLGELGGQTCQGLGHDGGELVCTDQCTLDDSGCHDCGASDPCTGRDCGPGEGTCRLYDCQAYCDCAEGNVIGRGLTCQAADYCKSLGEECASSMDCCRGACTTFGDGVERCMQIDCLADFQCEYHGDEDRQFCCIAIPFDDPDIGPAGSTFCGATPLDGECGTRDATCGASCVQGGYSDCAPGSVVASYDYDNDPSGYCAAPCETDPDCAACATEAFPGSTFSCRIGSADGDRFCLRDPEPCSSDEDCPGDLVCTVDQQPDGSYYGACYRLGGLETGAPCGEDDEDFYALPWDERCASSICHHNQCNGWCDSDADCPTGMSCSLFSFGYSICVPAAGSLGACERDADCPDDEVCLGDLDMDNEWQMRCVTRACDPAEASCLEAGEPCGQGLPNCSSRSCYSYTTGQYCWTGCQTHADCPESMACINHDITGATSDVSIGTCAPFAGSKTACEHDGDCPDGEVCAYLWGAIDGAEGLCRTPWGEGSTGESCINRSDCAAGYCADHDDGDFCTGPCVDNTDCSPGMICAKQNFSDDPEDYGGTCWLFDGSAVSCEWDGDCADGESCHHVWLRDGLDAICATADPDGLTLGEPCSENLDCESFMCFGGTCAAHCATDEHCGDGFLCMGFSYNDAPGVFSACKPWDGSGQTCQLDSECPAGEVCGLVARDAGDELEYGWACLTEQNPGGQAGDSCGGVGDDPCYNDMCLYDGIIQFCSATCLSTGDCPAGLFCGSFDWQPDVGVCAPIIGTSDPCLTDADCATPGEVCRLWVEMGQPLRGACLEIRGDGTAGPGEACEAREDCISMSCHEEVCFLQCNTTADCEALGLECTHKDFPNGQSLPMCLPPGEHSPYCTLCEFDSDCAGDAVCIDSVANPGEAYCGKPCVEAADCPEGASCVDVGAAVTNCVPDTDTCVPS